VLKCGGEKALTKHVVDDGLPKYHMPLEDANRIIEQNVVLPENPLSLCAGRLNAVPHNVDPKMGVAKPRAKVALLKTRLVRIMHRLDDLEPGNEPEKRLNIDLGVDLYQMEE
jgi:hypothetical protein